MKKQIVILLCLALLASFMPACSAAPAAEPSASPAAAAETPVETAPAPEPTEEPPAETETPDKEPEPADEEEPSQEEPEGHGPYTFQPKVCSVYMEEVFGKPMVDAWFSLVDAVMAGEDSFACPDAETYYWVMGQFPDKCFPVLDDMLYYAGNPDEPVVDGVARFMYLIPQEEAAARIDEFAALVEKILNETLEEDYSDLEKALALYKYFSDHYVYDYEAARPDVYVDYLSSYRALTTGTGICQEFSVAYAYLLMEAGVEATNMSGHRSYDGVGHQWTYVRINGHDFHIDPTYVVGDKNSLSYFMMDDAQREAEDCYYRYDYTITSNYAQDHPHPAYAAEDDSFRPIWRGYFLSFDHETRTLFYREYESDGRIATKSFDYTGW